MSYLNLDHKLAVVSEVMGVIEHYHHDRGIRPQPEVIRDIVLTVGSLLHLKTEPELVSLKRQEDVFADKARERIRDVLGIPARVSTANGNGSSIYQFQTMETDLTTPFKISTRNENDLAHEVGGTPSRTRRLVSRATSAAENIAHDLRTPLNRLQSKLEAAMVTPRKPEEYRRVLGEATTELEKIVQTFNAILKIARIKSGGIAPSQEPCNLVEVIEEVIDLYQAFAEDCGVSIETKLPLDTNKQSVPVSGDVYLIAQAVANLLENAIKYSRPGCKVSVIVAGSPGGTSLTIADNGPGIPTEKRATVLDRFVRLENSGSKEGFGIGLSFVSAVAEWHGARLLLTDNMPGLRATILFPPTQAGRTYVRETAI